MEIDNLLVVFVSFLVFLFLLFGIMDYIKIYFNDKNYIYIFSTIFTLTFLYVIYRLLVKI